MSPSLCHAALSLLMLGLATCGPSSADEPPPTEEWLVGEWFLGDWGDEYWDHHAIDWTRVDNDGTWTYGVRGCNGEVMIFGGTWRELEPGVAEFTADNEIEVLPFDGYVGATAQIQFEGTCDHAQIIYLTDDGEQFGDPLLITRGVACLDDCIGSKSFAVPCSGSEDLCADP